MRLRLHAREDDGLAGFVCYQGGNDGVNQQTAASEDERNFVNLIHDARRELKTPKLPVVIGVTGVGGTKAGEDVV